jgi:hypothetical protein
MKNTNLNNNSQSSNTGSRNAFYLKKDENFNPSAFRFDPRKMEYTLNKGITEQISDNICFVPGNTLYFDSLNQKTLSAITKTYAIKLAEAIIHDSGKNTLLKSSGIPGAECDKDILQIYLKQITLILRNTNIFHDKKNPLIERHSLFSSIELYMHLLNSFWNKVRWIELFPSMPKTADILQTNRKVLAKIMIDGNNKFRLDKVTNDYCNITGAGGQNNLLFISFMDFYFFSWLSHFGLVNYILGNETDPVKMEITMYGRKILGYLASK